MKAYKKLTIIATIISVMAFLLAVILHYCYPCYETEFWINVCLGLFGSAVLTVLTSVVTYWYDKIKTLESFQSHTLQLLSIANKYQENMLLEEKIRFFLSYNEFDKIAWDSDFGNIDFFFERITRSRKYIYYNIYKPILDFNQAVANHVWHFRWHLDGSGKNDVVMQKFVDELQSYLLRITEKDVPTEYDENNNPISFCHYRTAEPKLVFDVKRELGGRYYNIMYGKRKAEKFGKELKEREVQSNGQDEI